MDYLLKIMCRTVEQAEEVCKSWLKEGKGFYIEKFEEKIKTYNLKYDIYQVEDLLNISITAKDVLLKITDVSAKRLGNANTAQSKEERNLLQRPSKGKEAAVDTSNTLDLSATVEGKSKKMENKQTSTVHREGMPINEFLRTNKHVRTVAEVEKYYSREIIERAHKKGVFEIFGGRIKY